MTEDAIPQPATFVRGDDHLDRLLADPQIAADVAWPTPRPRKWTGSTQ